MGALCAQAPLCAWADDLPNFQVGQWQISRGLGDTASRAPQSTQKCTDPGAEVRRNIALLKIKHCTFTPITHVGNRYSWSSSCPAAAGVLAMQTQLTADSADAYHVVVQAREADRTVRTTTQAQRIGDCPPPMLRRPSTPTTNTSSDESATDTPVDKPASGNTSTTE